MENNDTTVKENKEVSNPDEQKEVSTKEEKVELDVEPKRKSRQYFRYLPTGFLVIVGSLTMVNDLYNLFTSYYEYLSTYQMNFLDLPFSDKSNFFIYVLRFLSLGIAQIVIGLLLYVYLKNKNDVKAHAL
jgi:hypothetical protein